MKDCVFCQIRGKIMSGEVKAFGHGACGPLPGGFLAFAPLKPATKGHTLVIPVHHYEDFRDLSYDETAALVVAVKECSEMLQKRYEPDGMNLITSAGAAASQTVMHLHWHVVPRYNGDRLGDIWAGMRED